MKSILNYRFKVLLGIFIIVLTLTIIIFYIVDRFRSGTNLLKLAQTDSLLVTRLNRNIPLFQRLNLSGLPPGSPDEIFAQWLKRNTERFADFYFEKRSRSPISCAVVANGITLRESSFGAAIDSHDYVFRMNNAPVSGFSQDIGTKTTFNVVVNNTESYIADYGSDTFAVVWGGSDQMFSITSQLMIGNTDFSNRLLMTNPAEQAVMITTGEFDAYVAEKWYLPEVRITNLDNASTGFRTIVLALHLCSSVDLYGFGPDAQGRWWHYFDQGNFLVRHYPDYQQRFISELVDRRIVRNHTGNMNPTLPPPTFDRHQNGAIPRMPQKK